MASENQHISMSHESPARYEAVETSYDPGRLLASDDALDTPSPALSKERTRSKRETHHDYKPTALRWWFHAFLIACLATFIGLTEYTIRTLQAYDGGDLASQLWSREISDRYEDMERKSTITKPYFQRVSRAFGNATSATATSTDYVTVTATSIISYLSDGKTTTFGRTDVGGATSTTVPEVYLSDGKTITTLTTTVITFMTAYLYVGKTTSTSTSATVIGLGGSSDTMILPTAYLSDGKTTSTSTISGGSTVLSPGADTSATTMVATTAYLSDGKTTSTSTVVTGISSQSQDHSGSAHVISVVLPTSPTTEAHAKTTTLSSASTITPVYSTSEASEAKSAGLQLATTITQSWIPTSPTTEAVDTTTTTEDSSAYFQIVPTLTTAYTVSNFESSGLDLGSTTSHSSGSAESVGSSSYLVVDQTMAPEIITVNPEVSSSLVGSQGADSPSGEILRPATTTTLQETAAGNTPIATVVQGTKTWAPSETWIEETTINSKGQSTIKTWETTLPGSTSVFQSTILIPSEATQGDVTVIQQTETWASSESTIEHTTTNSDGQTISQTLKTTLPGGTRTIQSTIAIPSLAVSTNAVSSEGHQGDVTVIQQTETWASSESIIKYTTTNSDGQTIVQTFKTTLPGGTRIMQSTIAMPSVSVLSNAVSSEGHWRDVTVIQQTETWPSTEMKIKQTTTNADGEIVVQTLETSSPGGTRIIESSVSVRPGETLVTVPTIMPTTVGGSTEVVQVTFSNAQGDTTISSYTTVLGGTPTLTTRSFFVATSLPPEDTVITIPTVVPTTLGGTTEVEETTFTNAYGSLTTSSYTTILGGTPTSTTVPVVIATPIPSGDVLVTISTVLPTTIGGTTEIVHTTFKNAHGHFTTSSYTTVLHGTPTSTTEWTIVPTPTSAGSAGVPSNSSDTKIIVYGIGSGEYLLGTFLPTVLAVLVAFPVKLISINARLMHPFHTLATADKTSGATLESSLFQRFDTWFGAFSLPLAIKRRQPVIAISDLLALGAALLTSLAAETVGVRVPDDCQSHCMGSLEVSIVVSRIMEALMATMAALLIALVVLLTVFRWRTGVSQNPWSIAGMASLCLNSETRDTLRSISRGLTGSVKDAEILKVLQENRFALGDFWTAPSPKTKSSKDYGVIVVRRDGVAKQLLEREESDGEEAEKSKTAYKRTQPFKLLTWWGRCLLIFVFSCLLIILTYYENTSRDSGFERFMDSQGFGVNFFFTALGVVIGACMEMVFRSVAIISPYLQLSNGVLPAERSVLLSPPTNAFYGIYSAIRQRHLFLGVLSFTTILGELFLPVTLSQVPFTLNETFKTQLVCTWLSIAILALMILVLAASFFTTWPHMPVDPRTVAGAMFYVCDSWMLETLKGMSTSSKKDRDLDVKYLRLRYGYGYISGAVSGRERVGVDVCDDTGEAAVIVRSEKWRYN